MVLDDLVVSNERGRASFYSGEGRFPPFQIRKHLSTALRKSRGHSTSKMGLIGLSGGSAEPLLLPLGSIFGRHTPCELLMGIAGCILRGDKDTPTLSKILPNLSRYKSPQNISLPNTAHRN